MIQTRQRNAEWSTRSSGSGGGSKQRLSRFRIAVETGPDSGVMVSSSGDELTIGTAPGNGLVLTDGSVSRHHCVIQIADDGFLLIDLDSRNGTRVSGTRVCKAYVDSGAIVSVGHSMLRFEAIGGVLEEPLSSRDTFGEVLGESVAMRRVFAMLERAAPTDASILLEGETGTGKSLIAQAIHEQSSRCDGPFMVLDCTSLSPGLAESELFGHVKGSFTGAIEEQVGFFEAADGGTIFLDEVGDLPLLLQPKLLRVLESRRVTPVGSTTSRPVDVRVVCATNRDLRRAVNRESFRADLYYRISTMRLRIPPLRERPEDIALLAAHFYQCFAGEDAEEGVPPELLQRVVGYSWPGNIRELRNSLQRAAITGSLSTSQSQQREHDLSLRFRDAKKAAVQTWEESYLRALMRAYRGNVSRAARSVKMDRNYLRELLARYGLSGR